MVFDKKLDIDFEFGSAVQERERDLEIFSFFFLTTRNLQIAITHTTALPKFPAIICNP